MRRHCRKEIANLICIRNLYFVVSNMATQVSGKLIYATYTGGRQTASQEQDEEARGRHSAADEHLPALACVSEFAASPPATSPASPRAASWTVQSPPLAMWHDMQDYEDEASAVDVATTIKSIGEPPDLAEEEFSAGLAALKDVEQACSQGGLSKRQRQRHRQKARQQSSPWLGKGGNGKGKGGTWLQKNWSCGIRKHSIACANHLAELVLDASASWAQVCAGLAL